MMNTKLTLNLNAEIINEAKTYAKNHQVSLSKLIENYLNSLISEKRNEELQISDFVKSMSTRTKLPMDVDFKKDRLNYLEEKYK
ncbi:MAG: hypothetical protein RIS20_2108 [Bacteroidota bacterium]